MRDVGLTLGKVVAGLVALLIVVAALALLAPPLVFVLLLAVLLWIVRALLPPRGAH